MTACRGKEGKKCIFLDAPPGTGGTKVSLPACRWSKANQPSSECQYQPMLFRQDTILAGLFLAFFAFRSDDDMSGGDHPNPFAERRRQNERHQKNVKRQLKHQQRIEAVRITNEKREQRIEAVRNIYGKIDEGELFQLSDALALRYGTEDSTRKLNVINREEYNNLKQGGIERPAIFYGKVPLPQFNGMWMKDREKQVIKQHIVGVKDIPKLIFNFVVVNLAFRAQDESDEEFDSFMKDELIEKISTTTRKTLDNPPETKKINYAIDRGEPDKYVQAIANYVLQDLKKRVPYLNEAEKDEAANKKAEKEAAKAQREAEAAKKKAEKDADKEAAKAQQEVEKEAETAAKKAEAEKEAEAAAVIQIPSGSETDSEPGFSRTVCRNEIGQYTRCE